MSLRPETLYGVGQNLKDLSAKFLLEGGVVLSSLSDLRNLATRSSVLQGTVRVGGVVLVVLAANMSRNNAQAEGFLFLSPTPRSENTLRNTLPTKEALQIIQNPIEFNIGSDHYLWSYNNASYNINPPNELVIPTGTIRVVKNGTYMSDQDFQGLQRLYSGLYGGNLHGLAIKGMAVNVSLNKFSLATATVRPFSNTWDVHVEVGVGVANAENYTGRQMIDKGLPAGGFSGAFSVYVTEGRDDRGNWTNVMFAGCDISSQDGTYQIRRDDNGNIIGDTFIKLSNSIVPDKPFQVVLPAVFKNY